MLVLCGVLLGGGGFAGALLLKPKAPAVDRSSLWTGRVERGSLVIEIKGTGALVPEEIRWLTSETSGRVDKRFVKGGSAVKADQPIIQLENPDLRLQALQAERDVAAARAELVKLKHDLGAATLSEEAADLALNSERDDVQRRAQAYSQHSDLFASLDLQQLSEHAKELRRRSDLEKSKLALLRNGVNQKSAAQRSQIEHAVEIAQFRARQIANLTVRAGAAGEVEDIPVELGQWVVPGTVLAKVVDPSRLKAELRVAEMQAKDVAIGQKAVIDLHPGTVEGRVVRIATAANAGTVKVEIQFTHELPRGARPDLSVDGYIEAERLDHVLHLVRPVGAQPDSDAIAFRIDPRGGSASRVSFRIGKTSVDHVEVRSGLNEGDELILSDMSRWSGFDSIVLK